MSGHRGYYSVIQCCPDPSRAEAANVGVLLFCPELGFIKTRMSKGNDRVSRFFGRDSFDAESLNLTKQSFAWRVDTERDHIRTIEDLERFIATRANDITVTPARPMRVEAPEADLDRLFDELVGGRAVRQTASAAPAFPELDAALREPSFASRVKVHFNVAVEVPVVGRVLRVPYECQNGRRSLLLPKLFSAMRGMDAAIMLACEGDLIQRHAARPGTTKLFVLPTYEDAETEAELGGAVSRIMGEYKVRTVSRQEIPELVGEVQRGDH